MEIICKLLGYDIHRMPSEWNFKQKECVVVSCLNPHSYVVAKHNEAYRTALQRSDVLLPDGEGIVLAARWLKGLKVKKMAGMDFQMSVLQQMNEAGGKVYYIGSNAATLARIAERIRQDYPAVECRTALPSRFELNMPDEENARFVREIQAFAPDVVLVGLGTCKQESWAERNREALRGYVSYVGNIGAAFGFLSGTKPRAPKLMVELKMEWLYRLLKEPRRMWRRVFVSGYVFLADVAREKLRLRRGL